MSGLDDAPDCPNLVACFVPMGDWWGASRPCLVTQQSAQGSWPRASRTGQDATTRTNTTLCNTDQRHSVSALVMVYICKSAARILTWLAACCTGVDAS
jgi:hypothetical protein